MLHSKQFGTGLAAAACHWPSLTGAAVTVPSDSMPQQQPHKVRSGVQARRGIRPCTLKSHSPGCQCPSDSAGKHRQHTRSHRHAHLPNTGCLSSKDQGMAGLDGPAPVDTWEGIGVSSFGAHLDGPDG
ncbi:hypothetical protein WJX74_001022 [Apatococcus lobatus]|uniref:Secreted protein n=1 Tax=Apatococcus lobatus TaxID=904363 RepID=A0AAW1RW31_9CHLO